MTDFQFYIKSYFGHNRALEKWYGGATGLKMLAPTSSTTLIFIIFFDVFSFLWSSFRFCSPPPRDGTHSGTTEGFHDLPLEHFDNHDYYDDTDADTDNRTGDDSDDDINTHIIVGSINDSESIPYS